MTVPSVDSEEVGHAAVPEPSVALPCHGRSQIVRIGSVADRASNRAHWATARTSSPLAGRFMSAGTPGHAEEIRASR